MTVLCLWMTKDQFLSVSSLISFSFTVLLGSFSVFFCPPRSFTEHFVVRMVVSQFCLHPLP